MSVQRTWRRIGEKWSAKSTTDGNVLKFGLQLFMGWLESRRLLDKLAYSGHGKSSGERGSVMI
jgi:hypothetical protein